MSAQLYRIVKVFGEPRRMSHCHATDEHMPFAGHRTMAEVIEDENRREILRDLGKGPKVA